MHIMEGYLPAKDCLIWGAASTPFVAAGVVHARKVMREKRSVTLLLGAVGGFVFVLSSLKLPSVAGSSSHATGIGLGAVLFGPLVMVLIGVIVLLFQALMLQHGGLTTLGANSFSMAIVGALVAFGVYKIGRRVGWGIPFAAGVAAGTGDFATYVTTSFQLALAFQDGAGGFTAAMFKYLAIFAPTQLPLAIGEGVLTALVLGYLVKESPQDLRDLGVLDTVATDVTLAGDAA